MLCGWRCGAKLTASQMRTHFTKCIKRPKGEPSSATFPMMSKEERIKQSLSL
jgi:hypothetical protein